MGKWEFFFSFFALLNFKVFHSSVFLMKMAFELVLYSLLFEFSEYNHLQK